MLMRTRKKLYQRRMTKVLRWRRRNTFGEIFFPTIIINPSDLSMMLPKDGFVDTPPIWGEQS